MIVSFKFYVMNFVDFVVDFCSHITSHVSQAFASCTHNTSYSLLNFVHIIVCVYGLTNHVWKILWVFMQNCFVALKRERLFKIQIFEKLGLKLVFWKSISSHTHAFLYLIFNVLMQAFKNQVISLKSCFSRISIDPIWFSINQNLV